MACRTFLYVFILLLSTDIGLSQGSNLKSGILTFHVNYGAGIPAGDLGDRYGLYNSIQGGLEYFTNKDITFGFEAKLLFGKNVKEDPLAIYRNDQDQILGLGSSPIDVFLRQRGLHVGFTGGKLISLGRERQGLKLNGGIGFIEHHIRFNDDNSVAGQLSGEYRKGYDRKTMGLTLKQEIVYQYFDKYRRTNFYAGIEVLEGFTKGVRAYDFDLQHANSERRLDILITLKVGWVLPFYRDNIDSEEIFY